MGAYRVLFIVNLINSFFFIYRYNEEVEGFHFGSLLLEFMISTIQTVTLVVFLVDWRLRCTEILQYSVLPVCGGGTGQCTD